MRSIASVYVCLSVCLSVCMVVCLPARISQNHMSKLHDLLYTLPVIVTRSSSDNNAIVLCATSVVDDVIFVYSGAESIK